MCYRPVLFFHNLCFVVFHSLKEKFDACFNSGEGFFLYFFNCLSLELPKSGNGCMGHKSKERDGRREPLFPLHALFIR
jgi:hypothetical protein